MSTLVVVNTEDTTRDVAPERVLSMIETRSHEISSALLQADASVLGAPSLLTDWSRLTIACHLRYGAQATRQVIEATLEGRPAAYYPGGRDLQRPFTLRPALSEPAAHVVDSLRHEVAELQRTLTALDPDSMASLIAQHADNRDLGQMTISDLVRLRLTEVQVHGTDLDLGLDAWPADFGPAVMAQRVALVQRRSVIGVGSKLMLVATDAMSSSVVVTADGIEAHGNTADASVISRLVGTANAHVAMLVGRGVAADLEIEGDIELAQAFVGSIVGP